MPMHRIDAAHRKIYQHVIDKERRGDYLGKTVQVKAHSSRRPNLSQPGVLTEATPGRRPSRWNHASASFATCFRLHKPLLETSFFSVVRGKLASLVRAGHSVPP